MWKAFVFGVVVAAAIGPIALLIFGTGARQGFASGAFAGLGAALADLFYALAAFSAGAVILPILAGHAFSIRVACALLLIGLGAAMLVGQMRSRQATAPAQSRLTQLPAHVRVDDRQPDDLRDVRRASFRSCLWRARSRMRRHSRQRWRRAAPP